MKITRRLTLMWSISSWVLLLIISCILHVAEARSATDSWRRLDKDALRSLMQLHPGSALVTKWLTNVINEQQSGPPLVTKWLANIINEQQSEITKKRPPWIRKGELDHHKNIKEDKEGVIKFNSIREYLEDNVTMVELHVTGEGNFVVTNLTFTYNGVDPHQELSSPWTGKPQVFDFEADIFESEYIELSLMGRNGNIDSPVTASGSVNFEFEDPGVQMAFVGSDTKPSVRIEGEVPDSGVSGSMACNKNGTACYYLEKDVSYCRIVTADEGYNITVCDSYKYIDPLNEVDDEIDLMWMDHEMEMEGMIMTMRMLMATANFPEMPAKMEVIIYADDDPSKIYSPMDYSCEIQYEYYKMDMNGTMCHQMLPDFIPSNQEGVQVLVVGLDENGNVIQSGLQHDIVHEDFTAIIVGACLSAVVGMACIVALVGCYVEKKKKKKLQDDLQSSSKPKL